jgi:K+-transporting ATPase ATPase A chain
MFPYFDLWDSAVLVALVLALAAPLGAYMGRVFLNRPVLGDRFLLPLEEGIYRFLGTSPRRSMRPGEYLTALLLFNAAVIAWLFAVLYLQPSFPLNPTHLPGMPWDLAFHSAASFDTNTDFVHFVPESSLSVGAQLLGIQIALFTSAGTGLAAAAAFSRGFIRKDGTIGNFYVDAVRSMTRILVPLALLGALLFALMGVPETLASQTLLHPLTGGTQPLSLGPVASFQSISLLGSNGGGWYAANAGSPLASPSAATGDLGLFLMLLLPLSFPFAFSSIVRRPGEGWPLLGAVLVVLFTAYALFVGVQSLGDPSLAHLAGVGTGGTPSIVGGEVRWNIAQSSIFQVTSVYGNVGANNIALSSVSPISQMVLLFGMFTQSTPGGDGTGFGVLLIYAILAVFVGGLMVGRTPEYLGKKITKDHVKWAAVVLLSHPIAVLLPLSVSLLGGFAQLPGGGLTGRSFGFTSLLYEFTSESANNGSAMGGFNDNTPFFNLAGAAIMLFGRYFPIIGMLAIAGLFARQDAVPPGPGTLRTASTTFSIFLALFVIVLSGLLFLPVLALGPLPQLTGGFP